MTTPNQYAIARRLAAGRTVYLIGRMIDVDLTIYFVPLRDGHHERIFTGPDHARLHAQTLGDVLPGFYEQDYTVPMNFAVISETEAAARRSVHIHYNPV